MDSPFLRAEDERKQWTPSLFFITRLPLMPAHPRSKRAWSKAIRWGVAKRRGGPSGGLGPKGWDTGDQRETILAIQATNTSDYLGYKLITQLGFQYERRAAEIVEKKPPLISAWGTGFRPASQPSSRCTPGWASSLWHVRLLPLLALLTLGPSELRAEEYEQSLGAGGTASDCNMSRAAAARSSTPSTLGCRSGTCPKNCTSEYRPQAVGVHQLCAEFLSAAIYRRRSTGDYF